MALVVPNVGETVLLDFMLKQNSSFPDYVLKLYSNNYSPSATTVLSDFTEATFSGYTGYTFTRSSWDAATSVGGQGSSSRTAVSWTTGSAETIYGYYVVTDTGSLLWAELFNTSKALQTNDILNVTLNFTLASA